MFLQQVFAEVTLKIPPNGVNVIRTILRVVALHDERRALDSVIVSLAFLEFSCPCEMNLVDACRLNLAHVFLGKWLPRFVDVGSQQPHEQLLLLFVQILGSDSGGLQRRGVSARAINDIVRRVFANDRGFLLIDRQHSH